MKRVLLRLEVLAQFRHADVDDANVVRVRAGALRIRVRARLQRGVSAEKIIKVQLGGVDIRCF